MHSTPNALLVQPGFPIARKSKNHKDVLPIGLLKLGAWYKSRGWNVRLVHGNELMTDFEPDHILVTSLFTYWSEYVAEAARYYRSLFPAAKLHVGGIYASLLPEDCKKRTGADAVFVGVHPEAEKFEADYSLLDEELDYQVLHASRGCIRRCKFCFTWKLEPEYKAVCSLDDRIHKNKVVLYDNNFLANPCINQLLEGLAEVRVNRRVVHYECQSGFDGRLLTSKLASLLKRARFINPRIAWDGRFAEVKRIHEQIELLMDARYSSKSISIFMLYNWSISFNEMERKRQKCWEWKVQITDCRFRPMRQLYDRFDARKNQTVLDYFIHETWTDEQVKRFRKNVRRQNICIRHGLRFHSSILERKGLPKDEISYLKNAPLDVVRSRLTDAWVPSESQAIQRLPA